MTDVHLDRPEDCQRTKIDIVVVTFNSAGVIGGLLDSIPLACGSLAFRVVVVDNASIDGTAAVVRTRGDALVLERPNRGFGAGINVGVSALQGTGPILVLNPDVRLDQGCVEALFMVMSATRAGIVVPRLCHGDGSLARSLRREPTIRRSLGFGDSGSAMMSEIVNDRGAYEYVHPVDWATGAVLLVDRACYGELDGFDELFFMYSEETDFSLRARDRGWLTYFAPDAEAIHDGGGSGRTSDLYAMQVLNRIRLYRRRHGFVSSLLLCALCMAREMAHAIVKDSDSRRALTALCGRRRPPLLGWTGSVLRRSTPERFPR